MYSLRISTLFIITLFTIETHYSYAFSEQNIIPGADQSVQDQPEVNVKVPLQMLLNGQEDCPRLQALGKKLLSDQEFCDLHLEVVDPRTNETRIFCSHRSILCLRSSVMKHRVRELLRTQVTTGKPKLRMPSMDPDVFKNVIRYIYIDKMDPYFDLKRNVIELYSIADYMKLPELMIMIEEYMKKKVQIRDIIVYLRWTKKFKLENMRAFIIDFIRTSLDMSPNDWGLFVEDLCISGGYHRPIYSPGVALQGK